MFFFVSFRIFFVMLDDSVVGKRGVLDWKIFFLSCSCLKLWDFEVIWW